MSHPLKQDMDESWSKTWTRGMLGGIFAGSLFGATYAMWNNIPVTMPFMSQGVFGGMTVSIYCVSHRIILYQRGKRLKSKDLSDRMLAGAVTGASFSFIYARGSPRLAIPMSFYFSIGAPAVHYLLNITSDTTRNFLRKKMSINDSEATDVSISRDPVVRHRDPFGSADLDEEKSIRVLDPEERGRCIEEEISKTNIFLRIFLRPVLAEFEDNLQKRIQRRELDHEMRIELWKERNP